MQNRNTKLVYLLMIMLSYACTTKPKPAVLEADASSLDQETRELALFPLGELEKVDAEQLKGNLSLEAVTIGQTPAALLKTELDGASDYILYRACSINQPRQCVEGKTAALAQLLVHLPAGKLKIDYQVCVLSERALGRECGKISSVYFQQEKSKASEEKNLLLALTETSEAIQQEALQVRAALKAYIESQGQMDAKPDAWRGLLENQLKMNPYRIGLLLDSPYWEELKLAVRSQQEPSRAEALQLAGQGPILEGSTLFVFGSVAVVAGLWGKHLEKSRTAVGRIKGVAEQGKGFIMDLFSPKAPTVANELQRDVSSMAVAFNKNFPELNAYISRAKTHLANPSIYKPLTIGGAIAIVAGLIVSAVSSLNLAEDQEMEKLTSRLSKIEQNIDSLRGKKQSLISQLEMHLKASSP